VSHLSLHWGGDPSRFALERSEIAAALRRLASTPCDARDGVGFAAGVFVGMVAVLVRARGRTITAKFFEAVLALAKGDDDAGSKLH
jgi:hypothetical protein